MCVITEFGEVGIKSDTMVAQMGKLLCQYINFCSDNLKFVVDLAMLSAKIMSPILMKGVDFSHCLELKYGEYDLPGCYIIGSEDLRVLRCHEGKGRNCHLVQCLAEYCRCFRVRITSSLFTSSSLVLIDGPRKINVLFRCSSDMHPSSISPQ